MEEKVHVLHNTGLTMHERFTLIANQAVRRRKPMPMRARLRGRGRTNPAQLDAIVQQLNQGIKPVALFRGRGRGRGALRRGTLRRAGSEGSLHSMPALRRRSNSVSYNGMQDHKNNNWRHSNGNLSKYSGSVNGSVHSAGSKGYWLRGDANLRRQQRGRARGRGRGRGGRVNQGRVERVMAAGQTRPARGYGRRGVRRLQRGQARGRRASGRGRGGTHRQQQAKPVPTREELDAQLDQYMSGSKAALDQQLDQYMLNAMDQK